MNASDAPPDVVLLVDIANVMGSRPDGWWRDRSGAAGRLMALLPSVIGAEVALPDDRGAVRIAEIRAVVEGAAQRAHAPKGVTVLRAEHDGDSEIVAEADRLSGAQQVPLVVTADRGLRLRLPQSALIAGPGWLNRLIGR